MRKNYNLHLQIIRASKFEVLVQFAVITSNDQRPSICSRLSGNQTYRERLLSERTYK